MANRFWIGGPWGRRSSRAHGLLTEELGKEARKPGTFTWKVKDHRRKQRLQGLGAVPGQGRKVA